MGFAHGDAMTAHPEHHLLTLQSVPSEEPVPKGSLGGLGVAAEAEQVFEGPQQDGALTSERLPKVHPKPKKVEHHCSFCSYSNRKRSLIIIHERIHTGERPFVCGVCRNVFASTSSLNAHSRKFHAGER
ncbi:zinc finger protein 574-like [Ornithodoros turicata]|uniref:zinc finger protein 574-like n=1 Tax=Ornithodoros turicata TaxID=34597 RepID=UPI0031394DDF